MKTVEALRPADPFSKGRVVNIFSKTDAGCIVLVLV